MLTKERLGRTRTIALTIVAASGLIGMTLQPALAKAPDIAKPAIAIANMDLSALIDHFRSMILNLEARIDELEKLLAENPPPAEEADEDDEAEVDETDEPEDNDVDEPEANETDEPEDNDVDEDKDDSDDEDEDDREEAEDDHDDEDEDDKDNKNERDHDDEDEDDDESDEDDD